MNISEKSDRIKRIYLANGIIEPNHIREIREKRGWSLAYASKVCGVSKGEISMIENLERIPNHLVIYKLSCGFGMPANKLFKIDNM